MRKMNQVIQPLLCHGQSKKRRYLKALLLSIMLLFCFSFSALASSGGISNDDPVGIINNMSDFIFGAIRAIGMILMGMGVVQIGMSFKSQDPSQRTTGFLCFFGGLIIAFAKPILDLIMT
jgi:TrbC/VIRB2 family.